MPTLYCKEYDITVTAASGCTWTALECKVLYDILLNHESVRSALTGTQDFTLYDVDSRMEFSFASIGSKMMLIDCFESREAPADGAALVVEDGFCHRGDALHIDDIPDPLELVWLDAETAKAAARCGCCRCGAIFSGTDIKETIRGGYGQSNIALCPACGINHVIAETIDVRVTEDNLWRWHMAMDDCYPLPGGQA